MLPKAHWIRAASRASLLSYSPHWQGRLLTARLQWIRTRVQEDPTVTYDLHAALSKDPNNVNMEDALDDYTKIQQAAIRAGKRPPKKKKPKFDAVGQHIGIRVINYDVPKRIRERLIAEGLEMDPHFYVSRYGLNKELVKQIRSAFRLFEIVRLEVGSPWTDNPTKFSERLEYRTGATVLDRAGARFLLYRGFTHADLARKGSGDLSCFTVGRDYEMRNPSRPSSQPPSPEGKGRTPQRTGQSGSSSPVHSSPGLAPRRSVSTTPWYEQTNQESSRVQPKPFMLEEETDEVPVLSAEDDKWDSLDSDDREEQELEDTDGDLSLPFDDEDWKALLSDEDEENDLEDTDEEPALPFGDEAVSSLESDESKEELNERPTQKSTLIDLDDTPETIVEGEVDKEEEKRTRILEARIRYNAARVNFRTLKKRKLQILRT